MSFLIINSKFPYLVRAFARTFSDVFIREEYKDLLLDSWRYCMKEKGLEVWAWVIMPSHVHMVIGTEGEDMQNILRDMKRHTSTKLKELLLTHPQESRRERVRWMMKKGRQKGKAQ